MNKRIRLCATICGAGVLLAASAGCMGQAGRLPADRAFALSASALSGTDSYGFAGELALYNPWGAMETKAAFEGEVNRHGSLKLNWTEPDDAASASRKGERIGEGYRPLSLLGPLGSRSSTIDYAEPPSPGEPVRIRLLLDEDAAKQRVADGLRKELEDMKADKRLFAKDPEETRKRLEAADRQLEAALSGLRVDTVVIWTANPKSWFPSRMTEETKLTYVWDGKTYSEKMTSETNFLAKE